MTTGHPELPDLTNKQIHDKLLECVHCERRIQNKTLILIQDIQVRKIYLQKGYGSIPQSCENQDKCATIKMMGLIPY